LEAQDALIPARFGQDMKRPFNSGGTGLDLMTLRANPLSAKEKT
jgi:hypothetical protein